MKMNLISIILFLSLSSCMKANLNNFADPANGTGIFYGYSFAPITQIVQEVITVALSIETPNFPTTIDNGATTNNIEIKFNKEIETDTTITIRSLDSSIKINNLSEVTLNFTKANSRTSQIFSITATSVLLIDPDITIEFESPLVQKTTKIITIKNKSNQQALIVKDSKGVQLNNSISLDALPGDQYTYAVTLKFKPIDNMTITLESSTLSSYSPTIDKTQLVFTPDNYNVSQSFTVTLASISASTPTSTNLSFSVYAKFSASSIGFSANYTQNITPAIVVSGVLTVNKGGTSNLGISLSHKPDANRTVTVALSQSNFLSVNKTTFTFTPDNYNTSQTLQVTVSPLDYIFGAVTATLSTTGGYPANPVTININDPSNSYLDVSGTDIKRTEHQAIAIDNVNSKILIASNGSSNLYASQLKLSICNLDGTSCISKDVSAMTNQGEGSGYKPSMVIDTVNSKILISTENTANNKKPSLFRCSLDGSSCSHIDISAGRGNLSGGSPKLLLDNVNSKILLLTENSETGFSLRLSLFRCQLDGTGCVFSDISAGMGDLSSYAGRIAAGIDTTNSKLLAVTRNNFGTNNGRPSLFRCNLDGSSCTYTDVSAGQGSISGREPSLAIDLVNNKLFVTTSNYTVKYVASVFKCNLDGSSCTHTNLATTFDAKSTFGTMIFLDQANAKVLIAVNYTTGGTFYYPGLYRCSLDMINCTFNNLALTGGSIEQGYAPDIIIDTISAIPRILVGVTSGNQSNPKSQLIRIIRNYVD